MYFDFEFFIYLLIIIIPQTILGWQIGKQKNRESFGFAMGLIAGLFGCLIVAIMPSNYPPCKECGNPKNPKYNKCAKCGSE